ncbi:hypothetical protein BDQ12DRAFT_717903 [Crucibulum laeve]|uniref:Zn(2)-C6 fungal-type domain-containing protein n=1 Tax=Crucibulum laeve TaxID=68775 RepID=A0A5C3MTN4_9AGAR|nr:hypothetical protein BDQ12DRAFT_717903 [Crucibulum laeve]
MSSETAARKKRNNSETTPAPDGDHRKRRRNRTTQSCLNCHTSKRMCDRKRPACARCTQLGLTGLCVYEVDDPSQRSDTQDESSRLLKRVAELEGVIRELKNKPHPRWVQPGNSPSEEYDKWHTRAQFRGGSEEQSSSNAPSPPSSSSSEKGDSTSISGASPRSSSSIVKPGNTYPSSLHVHPDTSRRRPSYSSSSPQSTPSPALMTPTEEFSPSHVSILSPGEMSQEYDLASMFLSYPGLMGCEDNTYPTMSKGNQLDEPPFGKQLDNHCGCLHESSSYNVVLELSLRLRKAADILARSPSHQLSGGCLLNQRISELDTFATNALGNVATLSDELPGPVSPHERQRQMALNGHLVHSSQVYNSRPLPAATISPQSLHGLRSWDMMSGTTNSPVACDDSFMSWEPPRRT